MTVSVQTPINRSTGNGVTTVFPYTFKVLQAGDMKVTVGGVVKALTTDYTLTGVGTDSGNVTMLAAPANGTVVVLQRSMAYTRSIDYQDQGSLPAATLDDDQDAPVMMLQQFVVDVDRAVRYPIEDAAMADMPAAASRANKLLSFDALGNPTATLPLADSSTALRADLAASSGASLVGGTWFGGVVATIAALGTSLGASLLGFIQSGTGAVLRSIQDKLRESVSGKDFGAVGDGIADDTAAVLAANALGKSLTLTDLKHLFNISTYLAGGAPSHAGDHITIRDGQIKVKAGAYAVSAPGVVDYYGMWGLSGNNGLAFNLGFDGNGQATYTAYAPAGPNVFMIPLVLSGNKTGQKAIANAIDSNGGHAIEGANGSRMVMALNSAYQHNGMGTTLTDTFALVGNVSATTSDSHYFLNTVTNGVVAGNVGAGTVNGGGVDIAGGINNAVSGNVLTNGKSNGVWALKSPNTAVTYNRVLISGNLLYNNCNYPADEQGEVQVGDYNTLAAVQGSDVAVIGNYIAPQDTPGGSGYNRAVWIHAKTTNTAVVGNVISPDPALITAAQPIVQDKGSTFPIIAGNVCFSATPGTVSWDVAPVGQAHYANNVNMRIAPTSVGIPTAMESSDGIWNYHIVRNLPLTPITLIDMAWAAGYNCDIIEVMVASSGDNGTVSKRASVRGINSNFPVVLVDTTLFSLGSFPPVVTLDTSVSGRLRITANAGAGGSAGLAAFNIKVTSSYDTPNRFTPVFA